MQRFYRYLNDEGDTIAYAELIFSEAKTEESGTKTWLLNMIKVEPAYRGQQLGSKLLAHVVLDTEQGEDIKLYLGVEPTRNGGLSATHLRQWYRQFGFVSKPRNVNIMTREPHVRDNAFYSRFRVLQRHRDCGLCSGAVSKSSVSSDQEAGSPVTP